MGGYTIRRNRALGASEAGFTASVLGIPSICSMGPEGAELHSPSEYLSVDTVLPRCKMIALTAIQAARRFPPPAYRFAHPGFPRFPGAAQADPMRR